MITVYAEKFDVGAKIAAALSGFDFDGNRITMSNIEKFKPRLDKEVKPKGFIQITYKGEQYAITWGQGHMCGLKQAKDYDPTYANWKNIPIPFFPEYEIKVREKYDWATKKFTGEPDPWTVRQLNIVQQLFEKSSYIINATDDDREGELIFAYVYQYLECKKPYKRVVLDSQTESGFRDAFEHLKDSSEVKSVENAGRARAIGDLAVGSNVSVKATEKYKKYFPNLPMLTVGRIQTAVLDFIVEREKAIRNFKSHPFWNLHAVFTNSKGESYKAKHVESQIEDKAKADALFAKVNGKQGTVSKCETEPTKKQVPLLYNFAELSKAANKKYKITSASTLSIAQSLYEAGYITYPRTESQHLTSDMQDTVDGVLEMLRDFNPQYKEWIDNVSTRNYTKRHFDTSKVESHYAIIPTNVKPTNLSADQSKIYDLIAKSLIRIIYKDAIGEKTEILTIVEGEEFKSTGNVIIDPQWLVVDAMPSDSELLPKVSEGDVVNGEYSLKEGKTEPPKRYTDATLTTAMQTASKSIDDEELKKILQTTNKGGIGRPSTQAPIIETVVTRYCRREKEYIIPTEEAIKYIEILPISDLKSAEITAEWEMKLDKVAKGQMDYSEFVSQIESSVTKWCKIIDEDTREFEVQRSQDTLDIECPICGKPMRKLPWGWACSGYTGKDEPTSCKFALGYNMSGASLSDKDLTDLMTKHKTKYITGFKKKDSSETYGAYLTLDENGVIGRTWDTGLTCPKCGEGHIMVGTKGWSCNRWNQMPKCDFVIWDNFSGKKLSDSDKESLIEKKKTKLIKGFKKKDGGTYDAVLILKDDFTVGFPPKEK